MMAWFMRAIELVPRAAFFRDECRSVSRTLLFVRGKRGGDGKESGEREEERGERRKR